MVMIPIIGMLTSFATAVLIVYFIGRGRQRRIEIQAQMQAKLLDRFTTGPELVAFLQSPAGRQFAGSSESTSVMMTRERLLGGFTRSIVLTALGLAFLFLTYYQDNDFVVPAAILSSLGIGYFLATVVSYRLSSKLSIGQMPSSPGSESSDFSRL